MSPAYVYFLRAVDDTGAVKIGSTLDPERRLPELMRWSNVPLRIVCLIDGGANSGKDLERNIQDCFADAHSHAEWFHPIPRLIKAIAAMNNGVPVEQAINLSHRRGNVRFAIAEQSRVRNGKNPASVSRRLNAERRALLASQEQSA